MITKEQLQKIFPKLAAHPQRLAAYFEPLVAAMTKANITTAPRMAAFLAQIGHESDELKYMEEVWGPSPQQLKYEPPSSVAKALGNTQPGDGHRFRGAGPIQVTGRANFRIAGQAIGINLEAHPELAFTPEVGFQLATWYWTSRNLNALADQLRTKPAIDGPVFDRITKAINGGLSGMPQRDAYYQRACSALV
jgi:predicted chitinase